MVDIGGPWSRELCAGTHVESSAQIGIINLVSEASVGSSNRRIEALVGAEAFKSLATERAIVSELSANLKAPRDQILLRIADLSSALKSAEKKIADYESRAVRELVPSLLGQTLLVGDRKLIIAAVPGLNKVDDLRELVTAVREKLQSDDAVVALASIVDGKPSVIVGTTEASRGAGIKAGVIAKLAAGVLGGGGGGRDDMAQCGGADVTRVDEALSVITAELSK